MKRFLKVIDCTQQLQVRENVLGFEKALGEVKVIKDQIQYRSQSLLNFKLPRGYFSSLIFFAFSKPFVTHDPEKTRELLVSADMYVLCDMSARFARI